MNIKIKKSLSNEQSNTFAFHININSVFFRRCETANVHI